ncbi:MAG: RSP_7527 family protein [Burkholderiales bacterium]
MRLYAPLYEGDSMLRPDAAFGEPAVKVFKSPAPAPRFVRSNIQVEAANETALDIHAIEQIARRQRSVEIARMLKALFTAVGAWFERNEYFERDNFFAASENLSDLEQRQRHFERTGMAHY